MRINLTTGTGTGMLPIVVPIFSVVTVINHGSEIIFFLTCFSLVFWNTDPGGGGGRWYHERF